MRAPFGCARARRRPPGRFRCASTPSPAATAPQGAHDEGVDRGLGAGHDRAAAPFLHGHPIVIGDAAEHLVEAVLPLRERELQPRAIKNEAGRDLEHSSGGSVDIVTPPVSGDVGHGVRIETRVRRITERILIPAFLIGVGRPIRSDAPADVPSGARRSPGPALGPHVGGRTEDQHSTDGECDERCTTHEYPRRSVGHRSPDSSPPEWMDSPHSWLHDVTTMPSAQAAVKRVVRGHKIGAERQINECACHDSPPASARAARNIVHPRWRFASRWPSRHEALLGRDEKLYAPSGAIAPRARSL